MRVLLIFLFIAVAVSGCKKKPPPAKPNPPTPTAAIKVTVKHIIQFQPYQIDTLVVGAQVTLYMDPQDRADRINAVTTGVTDTSGVLQFNYLPEEFYYLTIEHDDLGYEEELVSTPVGTTSLVEILYY